MNRRDFLWGLVLLALVVHSAKPEHANSITVYYALSEKSGGRLEVEGPLGSRGALVFTAIPERQEVLFENIGDGLGPLSLVQNWGKTCAVRDPRNWVCLPSESSSPSILRMTEGRPSYGTLEVILAADGRGGNVDVWRLSWLDWWLVKHGMCPPWVRFDP